MATSFFNCASCFVGKRSLSMTFIATSRPLSRWTPEKTPSLKVRFQRRLFLIFPGFGELRSFSRPRLTLTQNGLQNSFLKVSLTYLTAEHNKWLIEAEHLSLRMRMWKFPTVWCITTIHTYLRKQFQTVLTREFHLGILGTVDWYPARIKNRTITFESCREKGKYWSRKALAW